jgi:hypothetical protein
MAVARTMGGSLACCHGFAVAAGNEPVGQVETPVFTGTALEPESLLLRTVEEIPGEFAAVSVTDVAAVDEAGRQITLRRTRDELFGGVPPAGPRPTGP